MTFSVSATSARTVAMVLGLVGATALAVGACSSDGGAGPSGDDAGASSGSSGNEGGGSSGNGGQACTKPADCDSKVCLSGQCQAPTDTDGVKNGTETDVDCGGPTAKKCDALKGCNDNNDCSTGVCADKGQGKLCQPPAADDGVKNGTETDIDCGGGAPTNAPKCVTGKACTVKDDCQSLVCVSNKCEEPTPADGVKNGTETDVDCGGPTAPPCADNLGCKVADDCTSKVCTGNVCKAPTATDGVKNGTETDVDCGGGAPTNAPKCAKAKTCVVDGDCASDGCDFDKKCALRRSCTSHYGGDTCGLGGPGGRGAAQWESCCRTEPVMVGGNTVFPDKYKVTSGRYREFLRRINGNVRKFIQDTRAANAFPSVGGTQAIMLASWDPYLPVSFNGNNDPPPKEISEPLQGGTVPADNIDGVYTGVWAHLGGVIFYQNSLSQTGCYVSAPGTHTYWMPKAIQDDMGDAMHAYSQAEYDTKALNCVNYLMAQAFCIWDGGRLLTDPEFKAIWGAANASQYPWGAAPQPKGQGGDTFFAYRYPTATDAMLRADPAVPAQYKPAANQSIEYGTYFYSYEYPNLIGTDYAAFINAPGRLTGRGPAGHADVIGPLMEISSTLTPAAGAAHPRSTVAGWNDPGSFEGHGWGYNSPWPASFHLLNKYGKQGLRCVYPSDYK
ncbi:MAG: hypothetical protein JNL38_02170 [Myxococcales bacterium]|nr:hypothetical protein [Myxococcales bacterium]